MIFNLLGSGLFLMGITILYDWTGYLSMTYIRDQVTNVVALGNMDPLVTITFALVTIGLAIKSGLFPFHFWMPDTYGSSTTAAKGVLSGLISKGYIILLIKMIYRTFGIDNVLNTRLVTILFILGV
jgi:multicomponent Na+:H+ antiporter subunit D